jgi:hypothetical protein
MPEKALPKKLDDLAFWQGLSLASLPISLHTLADIRTLHFRITVTSHTSKNGLKSMTQALAYKPQAIL